MLISRNEIMGVLSPERTASYTPVTNIDLISKVFNESHRNQYVMIDERYESDSTRNKFKMKFFMETGNGSPFQITVLNSYDKTIAVRSASGIYSEICWNLNMVGSSIFKHRHEADADIESLTFIKDSFDDYAKVESRHNNLVLNLGFEQLSKTEMAKLAGKFFIEDNLVNTEQLNILKKQILEPSFDYKLEDTALLFYNHLTHSIKNTGPLNYLNAHERLIETFEKEFDFTL